MSFELIRYTEPEAYGYDGSGISLTDIEFHEDDRQIVENLAMFFYNELKDELPGRMTRKHAFQKAKSLYMEDYDKGKVLSEYNYESGRVEAIKEAISYGYIVNITVKKPWHPKIFLDEDYISTYFLQHEYVVLYTGQKKHIFFTEERKQDLLEQRPYDHFNNAGSVLGQGFLAKDDPNRFTDERQTYYTTEPSNAKNYGRKGDPPLYDSSVVLEVCVPRSFLKYQLKKDSRANIDNLPKMNEYFGGPVNHNPSYNDVEFHIRKRLPLEYIMKVWDIEKSPEKPVFMPLNKYASVIKRDFPDRVPNLGNTNLMAPQDIQESTEKEISAVDRLNRVTQELQELVDNLKNLRSKNEEIVSSIKNLLERSSESTGPRNQFYGMDKVLDNVLRMTEEYNDLLNQTVSLMRDLGYQLHIEKSGVDGLKALQRSVAGNLKVFQQHQQELQKLENEVESKKNDMPSLKKDLVGSNIPEQKLESIMESFRTTENARPDILVENLKRMEFDREKIERSVKESRVKVRDKIRTVEAEAKKGLEVISYIYSMEEGLERAASVLEKNNYQIKSQEEYNRLYGILEDAGSSIQEPQYSQRLVKAALTAGYIDSRREFSKFDTVNVRSTRQMAKVVRSQMNRVKQNAEQLNSLKERLEGLIEKLEELDRAAVSSESAETEKELEAQAESIRGEVENDISSLRELLAGFENIVFDRESILNQGGSSRGMA
ncbi:MAG: hypothetical protein V5A72_00235 [Candidatus Nanohaloarchaea archaeon]